MALSRWLYPAVLALLFLPMSFAQDEKLHRLTLLDRSFDVRVYENLAVVQMSLRVKNKAEDLIEGSVILEAPAGAAFFDLQVTRNKPPEVRSSGFEYPEKGDANYKRLKVAGQSWEEEIPVSWNGKINIPGTSAGSYSEGKIPGLNRNRKWGPRVADPTLLEVRHGDQYRLRFFPVIPHDDQVVSVTYACELTAVDGVVDLVLPLPTELDMEIPKTATGRTTISIQSSGAVSIGKSSIPLTSLGGTSTKVLMTGPQGTHDAELKIRYTVGSDATTVDLSRVVTDFTTFVPTVAAAFSNAERAMLGKRMVQGIKPTTGADDVKILKISTEAHVVTPGASLLLVEGQKPPTTKEKRAPSSDGPPQKPPPGGGGGDGGGSGEKPPEPEPEFSLDEAKKCDHARKILGIGGLQHEPPCEEFIGTTNDPARLKWAKEHDLKTWPAAASLGYYNYQFIKHSKHCPLTEPNKKRLAELCKQLLRKREEDKDK